MSTETENKNSERNFEEEQKKILNTIHVAAFDNYLKAAYPNGTEGVPEEEIDKAFQAFRCGFNSGIFQSAGEILAMVGVNLSTLRPMAESEEERPIKK